MLRLCRHYDRNPTIIGLLVAVACRGVALDMIDLALRSGDVSDAVRDRLDEEIERSDLIAEHKKCLESDRAFGLEALGEMAAGKYREGAENFKFVWQTPAAFKKGQGAYLDYMALSISLVGRPYAEIKRNPAIEQALRSSGQLADEIAPATEAAHAAICRSLVFARCVRILNAIQRYEKQHPGQEPTVAELRLPTAITTDPFHGQPLRVVKQPAGWLIYGVDMNLKDDGGRLTAPIDCGFGPLPRTRED
jgi:hypothetical protein